LRGLLTLVVLGVLAGAAYYYWRYRPADVRGAREVLGSVGDKLQATKTAASVKAALKLDRELASYPIDVDAGDQEGVVILRGEVPSADVRAAAERRAAAVPDVGQVVNELRVDPALPRAADSGRTFGESFDDRALEAKVKMALSLDRDLKGTDIDVRSYRRQVTLRGQVDAPAQRQLAVDIARRTGDVAGVTDEMGVRGQAAPAPPPAAPTVRPRARTRPEAVPNSSLLDTL
jgi:hyperosmotically inducible periplasmic protein